MIARGVRAMKVLIAIDGSMESSRAVETAESLTWGPGSVIEILSVIPTDAELYGGPWTDVGFIRPDAMRERLAGERAELLDRTAARLRRPGVDVVTRLRTGRAASLIVDTADDLRADVILLGARSRGTIERAMLGSVSAEVVDQAHCAVLVARRRTAARILVGADGSTESLSAVGLVGRSGLFLTAITRVVHATDLHPYWWLGAVPADAAFAAESVDTVSDLARERAARVTNEAAADLRSAGLEVSTSIREGPASAVIVAEATRWQADLVVVGTRGHGLVKRLLLGSTARSVLHHTDASVLITRSTRVPVPPREPARARSAATPALAW
jgi:nucleotide-binding universal stress UspA family protein